MKHKPFGFTLIELMIVVAIIGILAAIAYPLYIDKVREARRVDAKSALLQIANAEEQYYTIKHQYTGTLGDLGVNGLNSSGITENGAYQVSVKLTGTQHFTATANAQGDQRNDTCVTFTLNDLGVKKAKATGGADATADCW
ncbi:MAG: prepilin-type N-terminal cleavage/methylation domain-containing protein [Salinisphaera sp.]|jgi:type IV pilus assembly protein PilE|nr:prepilin-type N-terminal cleavage/methylation domain-containing protein [Salinisphaera sp.]